MSVQVTIMGSITLALLLCVMVVYCWKRNRRLEYKYMKLIRHKPIPTSAPEGEKEQLDVDSVECETEMAAAESCALDDGEEEEEVSITVPIKGYGLINKIRSMTAGKVLAICVPFP